MNFLELKQANRQLNNQEIIEGATRVKSRPLRFWFDINGPCNLECQHCGFRAFGPHRIKRFPRRFTTSSSRR